MVERCLRVGLVGGEGFAVDTSLIAADAKQRWFRETSGTLMQMPDGLCGSISLPLTMPPSAPPRETTPKFISPSRPGPAQWTGAHKGHAFFAYATNYLTDTEHAIILDVEASRAVRQAEVGTSRAMLDRTAERFGLKPQSLVVDRA